MTVGVSAKIGTTGTWKNSGQSASPVVEASCVQDCLGRLGETEIGVGFAAELLNAILPGAQSDILGGSPGPGLANENDTAGESSGTRK